MARRRTVNITETTEEIQQLREHYTGTPTARALHFLILLKEDRRRTIASCAEEAGFSARKGERIWKRYREIGLRGVVGGGGSKRSLKSERAHERGALYSLESPSIGELLNLVADVERQEDHRSWHNSLKRLVCKVTPSVSHIVCNITHPTELKGQSLRPLMGVDLGNGQPTPNSRDYRSFKFHYQRLYSGAKDVDVDLSPYRCPPHGADYYVESAESRAEGRLGTYVGSLLFFCSHQNSTQDHPSGLARNDLNRIELLRPFFTQLFSNHIQKRFGKRKLAVELTHVVDEMATQFGLTTAQMRVLLLVCAGQSDKEMSGALSVSISTVRSHVQGIYKKVGVGTRIELVAQILVRANLLPGAG